ncbi:hypothetical protein ACET3Z_031085 [Daucus carota]
MLQRWCCTIRGAEAIGLKEALSWCKQQPGNSEGTPFPIIWFAGQYSLPSYKEFLLQQLATSQEVRCKALQFLAAKEQFSAGKRRVRT